MEVDDLHDTDYALEFLSEEYCEAEILVARGENLRFEEVRKSVRKANSPNYMYSVAAAHMDNFAVVVKSSAKVNMFFFVQSNDC